MMRALVMLWLLVGTAGCISDSESSVQEPVAESTQTVPEPFEFQTGPNPIQMRQYGEYNFTLDEPAWLLLHVTQEPADDPDLRWDWNGSYQDTYREGDSSMWWSRLLEPGEHRFVATSGPLMFNPDAAPVVVAGTFAPASGPDPIIGTLPENFTVSRTGLGWWGSNDTGQYYHLSRTIDVYSNVTLQLKVFNDASKDVLVEIFGDDGRIPLQSVRTPGNGEVLEFLLDRPQRYQVEATVNGTVIDGRMEDTLRMDGKFRAQA